MAQKRKTNPNKIPKSQADVDKAFDLGLETGMQMLLDVMVYTLGCDMDCEDEWLEHFHDEHGVPCPRRTDAAGYAEHGTRRKRMGDKPLMIFPNRSYAELLSSLDLSINACIREAERLLRETQSVTCFSCGRPLEIQIQGRRKYCAVCGCYLPGIIYDLQGERI